MSLSRPASPCAGAGRGGGAEPRGPRAPPGSGGRGGARGGAGAGVGGEHPRGRWPSLEEASGAALVAAPPNTVSVSSGQRQPHKPVQEAQRYGKDRTHEPARKEQGRKQTVQQPLPGGHVPPATGPVPAWRERASHRVPVRRHKGKESQHKNHQRSSHAHTSSSPRSPAITGSAASSGSVATYSTTISITPRGTRDRVVRRDARPRTPTGRPRRRSYRRPAAPARSWQRPPEHDLPLHVRLLQEVIVGHLDDA